MIRSLSLRVSFRYLSPGGSRHFSVLDQLSHSQLRPETRRRRFSSSGSKSALIDRLQHVDNSHVDVVAIKRRDSSTMLRTEVPPTVPAGPKMTLDIKLPDLSVASQLPGPHIPFLPDFWDSSHARDVDAIRYDADKEAPMRQVLVVGGTSSQHAEGPTYGSSDQGEHSVSDMVPDAPIIRKNGLWADVTEDLGLRVNFFNAPFIRARDAILSFTEDDHVRQQRQQSQSRPLNADEARGVWILLLILGGSWMAGGLFNPSSKKQYAKSH